MEKERIFISRKRKENLILLLDLLSSKEKQIDYINLVGVEVAFDELVSMWFDDSYKPEDDIFKLAYSNEELQALKVFNSFYDTLLNNISKNITYNFIEDSTWNDLIKLAEDTKINLKQVLNDKRRGVYK